MRSRTNAFFRSAPGPLGVVPLFVDSQGNEVRKFRVGCFEGFKMGCSAVLATFPAPSGGLLRAARLSLPLEAAAVPRASTMSSLCFAALVRKCLTGSRATCWPLLAPLTVSSSGLSFCCWLLL